MLYYTWTVKKSLLKIIYVIFDHVNVVWANFCIISFEKQIGVIIESFGTCHSGDDNGHRNKRLFHSGKLLYFKILNTCNIIKMHSVIYTFVYVRIPILIILKFLRDDFVIAVYTFIRNYRMW